jgi:hypothetical protein
MGEYPMNRRQLVHKVCGLALLLAFGSGCDWVRPSLFPTVEAIPPGEQIVLAAEPNGTEGLNFYVYHPKEGELREWRLQGGRGISEGYRWCGSNGDQQYWHAERRELVYSGAFGCDSGLYHIASDGAVTEPTLPALPPEVKAVEQQISAPDGTIALVGANDRPGSDNIWQRIYVKEGDYWAVYGAEENFAEIDYVRWSPDSQQLAFVAVARADEAQVPRAHIVDLATGTVRVLSQEEGPTGVVPTFTPDGGLLFIASDANGQETLYQALPGAAALPILSATHGPNRTLDLSSLLLAPDGRWAAFNGSRENATTPWTIYVVDLATGELRDMLPAAQADARTGDAPQDPPSIWALSWSPNGQQLLAGGDFAGNCSTIQMTGDVICTSQLYVLTGDEAKRLGTTDFTSVWFAFWIE